MLIDALLIVFVWRSQSHYHLFTSLQNRNCVDEVGTEVEKYFLPRVSEFWKWGLQIYQKNGRAFKKMKVSLFSIKKVI